MANYYFCFQNVELAFRHFFVHAYGFLLDEKELKLLVDNVFCVYSSFKAEIDTFIAK